jgi:hypothetical protein
LPAANELQPRNHDRIKLSLFRRKSLCWKKEMTIKQLASIPVDIEVILCELLWESTSSQKFNPCFNEDATGFDCFNANQVLISCHQCVVEIQIMQLFIIKKAIPDSYLQAKVTLS